MITTIYNKKTIKQEKIGIRISYYEEMLKNIQGSKKNDWFKKKLDQIYPEGTYTSETYEKLLKLQIKHELKYE